MHARDMSHSQIWHALFMCGPWRIHGCDMTHWYMRHDSLIRLIHMRDVTQSHVTCDSFICDMWLIHMWYVTHSHSVPAQTRATASVTFMSETWLIHISDMTDSYARHDSLIYATWLIDVWDMTHSYARHDSLICETWLSTCTRTSHRLHQILFTVVKALSVSVYRVKGVLMCMNLGRGVCLPI